MAKPKINVKWNDGTPIDAGVYLVAVRHITGFGSYDYLYWDGKQWLDDTTPNVTGWAVATDILNQIDADWPEGDKKADLEFEEYRKKHGGKASEDDFVEVD